MIYPRIIKYNSSEYREMLALRRKILREPLGLHFTEKDIEQEKDDLLLSICLSQNHKIAACCVLTPIDEKTVKLRQMAVDSSHQNIGLGTSMLSFAEYVASREGFENIVLNARKEAVDFYTKYDYKITGNEFIEVGIPHYKMKKDLER